MHHRTKKAVSVIVLLVYLTFYVIAAATLGSWLTPKLQPLAALIYYAVAGIIWVLPIKYLFAWMNKGAPPIPRARDLE